MILDYAKIRQLRSEVKRLNKENKRLQEERYFLNEAAGFFRREPSEVNKQERMKFIALKTCDGGAKGRISFCCKALKVTRQGFHEYLKIVINPRNTKNWRQK